VLDNFSTGLRANLATLIDRIDLVEGDLRNPDDCARACVDIDHVLHQGAIPSVPRSLADPILSHEVNVTGTLNLLIAARDARVRRLIYASSSSVYGNQPSDYKSEEQRRSPLSPYAASKASAEHYLAAFSECFGLETIGLRYFNVFGPRQDPNSPYSAVVSRFIDAVRDGRQPMVHGDGLQVRDFTYVENIVHANLLATSSGRRGTGQIYNIACGESYSVLDLLRMINEILGTDVEPIHTDARVGDVRESKADISRAREELGYEPIVTFEEGLRRTIQWYETMRVSA
jgi:nucleoside-diphosphate-sugar epimerase